MPVKSGNDETAGVGAPDACTQPAVASPINAQQARVRNGTRFMGFPPGTMDKQAGTDAAARFGAVRDRRTAIGKVRVEHGRR